MAYSATMMADAAPCGAMVACSGFPLALNPHACKILAAGGAPGASLVRCVGDNLTYAAVMYQSGLGDVGQAIWQAGSWTIRLHVTVGESSYRWRNIAICRVNLACGVVTTIATFLGQPIATLTAGSYTQVVVAPADSVGDPSDMIYIVLGIRKTSPGVGAIQVTCDQLIETPILLLGAPPVRDPDVATARAGLEAFQARPSGVLGPARPAAEWSPLAGGEAAGARGRIEGEGVGARGVAGRASPAGTGEGAVVD